MSSIDVEKKEKKMKKAKKENEETAVPMRIEKKSKESKKRKSLDMDVSAGDKENKSNPMNNAKPNSDNLVFHVNGTKKRSKKHRVELEEKYSKIKNAVEQFRSLCWMTKKKAKKAKVEQKEKNREEDENFIAVSQFRISERLRTQLEEKKIKSLSPIEAMTFDNILDGFDLMAQAGTDQDKTLAFVLPILESLIQSSPEQSKKNAYRAPSAIVLLPTRDLAVQVLKEFGIYGGSLGLVPCCVHGGSSHKSQAKRLKRGRVDIVVGTPGRVKDQIEEGNIDLSSLKFRVLGEADELSKKGLVEHVEFILGKVNDVTKVQTLLFSTTMPRWVEQIAPSRYLKSNYKKVVLAKKVAN